MLYPTWILYSTLYDAAGFIEFFAAYYIFNSLLVTLQLLHILWTYFLFKVNILIKDYQICIVNPCRQFTRPLQKEVLMTKEVIVNPLKMRTRMN